MSTAISIDRLRLARNGIYAIGLLGGQTDALTVAKQAAVGALFDIGYQGLNGYAGLTTRRANWVWLYQPDHTILCIGGLNSEIFAGLSVSAGFTSPGFSPTPPIKIMQPAAPDSLQIFAAGQGAIPNFAGLQHFIFGHSYGGILGLAIAKLIKPVTTKICLITYGMPKPGATGVYDDGPDEWYDLANNDDPIPRLPPTLDDVVSPLPFPPPGWVISFRNSNEFTAIGRKIVLISPNFRASGVNQPLLTLNQASQLERFVQYGAIAPFRQAHSYQEYFRRLSGLVTNIENAVPIQLGLAAGALDKAESEPVRLPPTNIPPGSESSRGFRVSQSGNLVLDEPFGRQPFPPPPPPPPGTPVSQPSGRKPRLVSFSPASGPQSGGTVVTIRGVGLSGVTEVWFGDVPCPVVTHPSVAVLTDTLLLATTPRGDVGQVRIGLQWPGGFVPGRSGQTYEYTSPIGTPP